MKLHVKMGRYAGQVNFKLGTKKLIYMILPGIKPGFSSVLFQSTLERPVIQKSNFSYNFFRTDLPSLML